MFLKPEKLQNHNKEGKGKQKKKERGEGKEEKRKKAMVALLIFIIATNSDNVIKNPARYTCRSKFLGSRHDQLCGSLERNRSVIYEVHYHLIIILLFVI